MEIVDEARKDPTAAVFYSRITELVLVRRPKVEDHLSTGLTVTKQEGIKYRFRPAGGVGVLVVHTGDDELVDGSAWLAAGEDQRLKRDIVDALKAHQYFNRDFWLEGEEPDRLRPTDEEFLAEVSDGLAELDIAKLRNVLKQEEDTHARPLLLRTARHALEKAQTTRATLEAAAAEGNAENASETGDQDKPPAKTSRTTAKK